MINKGSYTAEVSLFDTNYNTQI